MKFSGGEAPVDCNPAEQSSTRCELSGILAGIMAVERVTLGQARGIITAGCDSAGALSGIRHWTRNRQATRRMQGGENVDLLREIWAVLKRLPHLTMAWLKVKAHLKRPPELVHEILNEKMDSLAKSSHQNHMWQA
jgi:ribonuclease HI